jgi:hypothetical protein
MTTDILAQQAELRSQLWSVLSGLEFALDDSDVDLIVTHSEVNNRHGTGILLQRLFPDSREIVTIRSKNLYDGCQEFGAFDLCLPSEKLSRSEIAAKIDETLGSRKPRRILLVPYYAYDILIALALKDRFKVPLCTYVMDDQNIYVKNIPDSYLNEILQKSDLRFGISRDLCHAYEKKYKVKFWFLPPVAPADLIQTRPQLPVEKREQPKAGILIGNIWSQIWLDQLRLLTRETGERVNWYGNPNREWLAFQEADLQKDGIYFRGYAPEDQLIQALRSAPYAIILTGTTNELEDRPELAKLSLPSRLPYIIAVANTPMIVIGSRETAAAKFVEEFHLGYVCEYTPEAFCQAVASICDSIAQQEIRQRAAELAGSLSAEGMGDWIWRSLEKGRPFDLRFKQFGQFIADANVVITQNEVNQRHGTGALVRRIVADTPNILSIRSLDDYGGEHQFGDISFCLSHRGLSRKDAFQNVINALGGNTIKRIFCVPYSPDTLITAIALKELCDIPLGAYIMDDQNIYTNHIPDHLMREFLTKCSLRLATHPELRDAYEAKYGLKFWLLPAVVPDQLISSSAKIPDLTARSSNLGALIGSIWSLQWFELLSTTIRDAGVKLDWYGNTEYYWMKDTPEQLQQRGLNPCGLLPESQLAETLSTYPFVIVPTGTLDERDDHPELSRLSLPGRIIFALATANIPVIILGSEKTSAAAFVQRFKIGATCAYDGESLRQAIDRVTDAKTQQQMRQNAAAVASKFSAKGINQWLWQSIDLGEPADLRFEELLPRSPGDIVVFIEPPVPTDIYKDFVPVYQVARRMSRQGFQPDFVVDVGSSYGIWSHATS